MPSATKKKTLRSSTHTKKSEKPTSGYLIAIPSYKRVTTLRDKTLTFLKHQKIPSRLIHVFVANSEQEKLYRDTLQPGSYGKIIVGIVGMKNIRNFIAQYFPKGQAIFNLDDDISNMVELLKNRGNKTGEKPVSRKLPVGNLDRVIRQGFQECRKHQLSLFGIYPASNPFFMKKRVTHDLRYIIGSCWGCFNDPQILVTMDDKEDFERTIKFYLRDGGVVRLEHITVESSYYTEKGGMQETRTKNRVLRSAKLLVQRYPQLCKLNLTKKSGYAEVKLRDARPDPPRNIPHTLL